MIYDNRRSEFTMWNIATNQQVVLDVPSSNASLHDGNTSNERYIMMKGGDLGAVYIWDLSKLTGDIPHPADYIITDELYPHAYFSERDTISTSRDTSTPQHTERDRQEITYYDYNFVTGEMRSRSVTLRAWR